MKELSIEEKVIALLNSKELSEEQKEKLGEIFPELKESEDERIRKALISFLKSPFVNENITDEKVAPWLSWLEKQGNLMKALQFANKTIGEITDENYHLREKLNEQKSYGQREECVDCQCNYAGECKGYCGIKQGEQKPAFEMKTPEESLGIDSDTYNKIVDECIYGDDKPAWSEEDELHIRELEGLVKQVWAIAEHENDKDTIHKMSNLSFFLKTLKPQSKQE